MHFKRDAHVEQEQLKLWSCQMLEVSLLLNSGKSIKLLSRHERKVCIFLLETLTHTHREISEACLSFLCFSSIILDSLLFQVSFVLQHCLSPCFVWGHVFPSFLLVSGSLQFTWLIWILTITNGCLEALDWWLSKGLLSFIMEMNSAHWW